MGKFFEALKEGLEEAIEYEKGKLLEIIDLELFDKGMRIAG